ncbi:MAG TPA: nitroreductase family protein [Acidimicrobiales bacterium]|nr:nitroreductase family protein [Acidimicrobiales bacterium]
MELSEAVRRRRMVRSFTTDAVAPEVVDRLLDAAVRAPSAGFTQGWAFVVLEGADQTDRFWRHALPPERREGFPWPGLVRAPVLIVPLSSEQAYRNRYGEPDKADTGLAADPWPVPYWDVDCAFATMLLLLGAVDEGLGALFFGISWGEAEVLAELGVPPEFRPIGAVALGHPGGDDRRSTSLARGRRPMDEVVHRGGW